MEDYENFKPDSEEERKWVEQYNTLSKYLSEEVRKLSKEERLPLLRDSKPTDQSLMNLYLQAKEKEDYETCEAAKTLLLERGITPK